MPPFQVSNVPYILVKKSGCTCTYNKAHGDVNSGPRMVVLVPKGSEYRYAGADRHAHHVLATKTTPDGMRTTYDAEIARIAFHMRRDIVVLAGRHMHSARDPSMSSALQNRGGRRGRFGRTSHCAKSDLGSRVVREPLVRRGTKSPNGESTLRELV
ncbi:hypothetical protein BC827DRAFT_1157938 [Russula dissimulans]|nr:hypothetical protein BC827DRAFT_1157938 [Russula dissimulans]